MKRKTSNAKHKRAVRHAGKFDVIVFWTTLLVLLAANFFAAIVIVSLIFFASALQFYLLLAALGLAFGYVFDVLISGVKGMRIHHHLIAILLTPAFAIVTMIIISASIAEFAAVFGLEANRDPAAISVFYAVFFVMPYFVLSPGKRKTVKRKSKKKS